MAESLLIESPLTLHEMRSPRLDLDLNYFIRLGRRRALFRAALRATRGQSSSRCRSLPSDTAQISRTVQKQCAGCVLNSKQPRCVLHTLATLTNT
jgi:hypothetical protein